MAIATEDFKEWGIRAIEKYIGKEWYKKGVSKDICVTLFHACPFGDSQWLSWTKLQSLLREEKREIREELNPLLRLKREQRERERAEEKEEERIDKELILVAGMGAEEREHQKHLLQKHGALKRIYEREVCLFCGAIIPAESKAVVRRERSFCGKMYVQCMNCVRKEQKGCDTLAKLIEQPVQALDHGTGCGNIGNSNVCPITESLSWRRRKCGEYYEVKT